jgi:uncharacterized protein (DUF885 family)
MKRKYMNYPRCRGLDCWIIVILLCPLSAACKLETITTNPSIQLHQLFSDYLEWRYELDPYYATTKRDMRYNHLFANTGSSQWIERRIDLEEHFLQAVSRIRDEGMTRRDRIDREVFLYTRAKQLNYYRHPYHLLSISPTHSRLNSFARMGSGSHYFPFETVSDYENWLARVAAAKPWFEQLILNLREGMKTGVVHPKVIAKRILPQIDAHIVENVEDSLYFKPIINMPAHFSAADSKRLDAEFRRMILKDLIPVYQRISEFLNNEYIPAARHSVSWRELPNGDNWYRQRIQYYTSLNLTGREIHHIGLKQVAQLGLKMDELRRQAGLRGQSSNWLQQLRDDPEQLYNSEQEALDAYRSLLDRANTGVERVFSLTPRTRLKVLPVEAFRAGSAASASYRRPPVDLSGPGIFYVNASDLKLQPKYNVETLFLHEAIPGHHLQLALLMEMEDLPRIRRFETETAYTEGWALYAQSLGSEMGFYQDLSQQIGYLNSMQFRAVRLVVDTGLHLLGWSREKAIRYMSEHTARSALSVHNEIDRYIARPGQALAYMIGNLQFIELRRTAKSALGEKFDIREFHTAVLEDGALPLPILSDKIDAWIKEVITTSEAES